MSLQQPDERFRRQLWAWSALRRGRERPGLSELWAVAEEHEHSLSWRHVAAMSELLGNRAPAAPAAFLIEFVGEFFRSLGGRATALDPLAATPALLLGVIETAGLKSGIGLMPDDRIRSLA